VSIYINIRKGWGLRGPKKAFSLRCEAWKSSFP
jgi:hypothetical protein